jgi:hypothetical protein
LDVVIGQAMRGQPAAIQKGLATMITGEKNAPNLADRGKSTFSEGGGDKGFVQKSTTVRNCNGSIAAMQQLRRAEMKKLVKSQAWIPQEGSGATARYNKGTRPWNAQSAGPVPQEPAQAWAFWPKRAAVT